MFQVLPFLPWLAVVTSGVLLIALWVTAELGPRSFVLVGWFVVAACCQLFGTSGTVWAAGLGLQTALAVYLLLRWKLGS